MTFTLEFGILGPLEVRRGELDVTPTRAKVRALLAYLLLRAGEQVSTDRLVHELWGDAPPDAPRTALQVHVSRLRKGLGDNESAVIRTTPAGYVLAADTARIDCRRFARLMDSARDARVAGDPAGAVGRLDEALVLWRGEPLRDIEFQSVGVEASKLDDLLLDAVEERFDALLALGRQAELIAQLELAVAHAPLRERRWQQLMLALYRAGRQADSLAAYRRARAALGELALEPGPALRRLERAVLLQDPSLDPDRREPAALRQARAIVDAVSRATSNLPQEDLGRLALLPELGESLLDLGEFAAAEEVLDEAVRAAHALGRRELEMHAKVVRVRLQLRAAPSAPLEELTRTTAEAVGFFERRGDERRLAEALSLHAGTLWRRCRAGETEAALLRAIDAARRTGDKRVVHRSEHLRLGCAVFGPLRVDRGIARCLQILDESGDETRLREAALRALAILTAMDGAFDTARAAVEEDRRIAEGVLGAVVAADATSVHAMVELAAGDVGAAEQLLRGAYGALGQLGEHSMRAVVAAQLARVLESRGAVAEALAFALEAEEEAGPMHVHVHTLASGARARALAARGDAGGALAAAGRAVALAEATDFLTDQADAHLDLAVVLGRLDRSGAAAAERRTAAALFRRKGDRAGLRRVRPEPAALVS
jgi:DNA-binding SARP family transcriptional activator